VNDGRQERRRRNGNYCRIKEDAKRQSVSDDKSISVNGKRSQGDREIRVKAIRHEPHGIQGVSVRRARLVLVFALNERKRTHCTALTGNPQEQRSKGGLGD